MYNITLPFPPSINAAYGQAGGKQRFKSPQYKRWLLSCPAVTNRPMINEPICVTYDFYLPDNRIRDIPNYEKCVTDFLVNNQIISDDNWKIVRHTTLNFGGICKENPRVEVSIKKLQ